MEMGEEKSGDQAFIIVSKGEIGNSILPLRNQFYHSWHAADYLTFKLTE